MPQQQIRTTENALVACIGDEDTVTGMVMAGIGQRDGRGSENWFVVTPQTKVTEIEDKFKEFTTRNNIAIILINQFIADKIRFHVDTYSEIVPTVLEIPSKTCPYDASKDSVMQRVKVFYGGVLPGETTTKTTAQK
eukprot:GHVH01008809.1.p1 GENE.GHVH01008809.1~~GHVH01008809.1.p1  ORF type:complete len:136 (+),score=19.37 GHVH01008809.1:85-492(+)